MNDPEQSIKVTCETSFSRSTLFLILFFKQVYGAQGLVKRELLSLPDPFAVLTVDGEQTRTTAIVRKSLTPTWDEEFEMQVSYPSSPHILTHLYHQHRPPILRYRDSSF